MGINEFFEGKLGARVRNQRWSWGAFDETNHRVFLRLWSDEILDIGDTQYIRVLDLRGEESHAYRERKEHLDLVLRGGAACYGVLCHPSDAEHSRIKSFRQDRLLALVPPAIERDETKLLRVLRSVPTESLNGSSSGWSALGRELLQREHLDEEQATVREADGLARVGQGLFRSRVIDLWDRRCAVTGIPHLPMLRASHIKPWALSTNHERLDAENGLLLTANLDALFDAGDIGFRPDGTMVISSRISRDLSLAVGLGGRLLRRPSRRMQVYLDFHMSTIFGALITIG